MQTHVKEENKKLPLSQTYHYYFAIEELALLNTALFHSLTGLSLFKVPHFFFPSISQLQVNFTLMRNVQKTQCDSCRKEFSKTNRSWCRVHSRYCTFVMWLNWMIWILARTFVGTRSLVRRRRSCVTVADRRRRQASCRAAATVDGAAGGGSSRATSSRRDVFAFTLTQLKGLFSTCLKGRLLFFY